jgi:fermentation-respiration switch protein FrsA (DUF1100 family)
MLVKILFSLALILFIIILLIKRFIYFHPIYEFLSPKDNFQDIYEGNLHAWYKKGTTGKVILFCHGNAGNVSHRQDKLIEFLKMHHSILIFDYSGFGQSKGVPSEEMCYSNADIFYRYLIEKGYPKNNIIPYGESLGGAVASHTALKYNLPLVILESPIPGMKYIIENMFSYFSKILGIIFNEFDTVQFLSSYKGRIVLIHSVDDEVISYDIILRKIKPILDSKPDSVFIQTTGGHNSVNVPWENIKTILN